MAEEPQNTELLPFSAGESICALVWLPTFCALALLLDYFSPYWKLLHLLTGVVCLTGSLIAASYILLNLRRLLGDTLDWSLKRRMLCTVLCIIGGPMFCHCLIVAVAQKKHRKVTAGCAVAGILLGGAQWLGAFWFLFGVLKSDRAQMMFFALCAICSYALAVFNTLDLRRTEDLISRRQRVLFASGLALWMLLLGCEVFRGVKVNTEEQNVLSQIKTAIGGPIPTQEDLLAASPPVGDFTPFHLLMSRSKSQLELPDHDSSPEQLRSWLEAHASIISEIEQLAGGTIPRPADSSLGISLSRRDLFIFYAANVIDLKGIAMKEESSLKLLDNLQTEYLRSPNTDLFLFQFIEACRKECAGAINVPYTPIPPPDPKKQLANNTALLHHCGIAPGSSTSKGRIRAAIQCFAGLPIHLSDERFLPTVLNATLTQYYEENHGMED